MTAETDAEFVERIESRWMIAAPEADITRLFALARRGAAVENHGQDAKPSEASSQWEWPKGFFKIERSIMDRCASDGCGQVPSIRMEHGGVWSIYCDPCARKIASLITLPPAGAER